VTRSEGEELARKSGTLFIETSAKTTTGVRDAFEELVQKVNELTQIVETPRLWQVTSSGSGLDLSAQSPADGSCSC
jgi:Ras-related protein Rab-18